jgi:MFS family permease
MALPVLFAEISADLGLSLVQIGAIWGAGSFAGLFTGLAGGAVGDRFGTKLTLAIGCLAAGLTGALQGFSSDFVTLAATVILNGLVVTSMPMNLHKTCGVWFSGKRLGLANAVVAAGMAFGFMTGSMLSATVLSPWLGGWRQVLFFYAGVAVLMSLPWFLSRSAPGDGAGSELARDMPSMRRALSQVLSLEKSCRALSREVVPVLTLGSSLLSLSETTDFRQGGQLWPDEGRPRALLNASKSASGGKQVKRIQRLQW